MSIDDISKSKRVELSKLGFYIAECPNCDREHTVVQTIGWMLCELCDEEFTWKYESGDEL